MNKKYFGVMLDMSRNSVMKPEEVKKFAKTISSFGYNMIELYTEDTYEVEGEPYFGYMRGRYTKAELRDMAEYCDSIGVELVPCIQTLAHLNQIFRWTEYEAINDTEDILLVENERTYELIENMFKTLSESFTSRLVNIGMDEAHLVGLGKYLDRHGFENRFDIIRRHLCRVIEIANKYGFKPQMWSDMFFRLANEGRYYGKGAVITDEIKAAVPEGVELVFWDYYHTDREMYDDMLRAHLEFDRPVWFGGGAWTWYGFAPYNDRTMKRMLPAMEACRERGIDNIFFTMWQDDGGECSFYSILPALFLLRRAYEGKTDRAELSREFYELTGESLDAMWALDLPNEVAEDKLIVCNASKYMLYSDPFLGYMDATVDKDCRAVYKSYAKRLRRLSKESRSYSYIFDSMAALCEVMAIKYNLGADTRAAYKAGDKAALAALCEDYKKLERRIEAFYRTERELWFRENKPHGFEVQDARLGGLVKRVESCRERLAAYIAGELASIPELEDELLPFAGHPFVGATAPVSYNGWARVASPGRFTF